MKPTLNPDAISRYTSGRGVENLNSGPRTRKTCGFFIPPCRTSFNGLEGREIPRIPAADYYGFEPPSRPLLGFH